MFAQHIRHFASGLISFAEYERRVDDIPSCEWDRAMSEMNSWIWGVQLD
jgi:hypothetical protein